MDKRQGPSILSFVWRDTDSVSSILQTARISGIRAIIDLSVASPDRWATSQLWSGGLSEAIDIKITPSQFPDENLTIMIHQTGIRRVWMELHPADGVDDCIEMIKADPGDLMIFPVISDVHLLGRMLDTIPDLDNLVVKGCEASGFVGPESTLSLYSFALEKIRARRRPINIFIWGGIATPEAAAAFLSAGAAGIVFESLHWLTDAVSIDTRTAEKIATLQPDHSGLVGLNLQAPCRLFNKGNSRAVRELQRFSGSMCGGEIRTEQRRSFMDRIRAEAVHPLDSVFGRDELIPIGVEAAFARSFVDQFGTDTIRAVERFKAAVEVHCRKAETKAKRYSESPVAEEFGTRYPFIQGAMTWITDVPEFAREVAEAGALPTIALGTLDMRTIRQRFDGLKEKMGVRPYAINVVCLPENPFRDEHLAWILRTKPKYAVIAAGEPLHARKLLSAGIEVIYVASSEKLIEIAFSEGIRYAICEGNEAGGHVGAFTTLTFSQMVHDLRRRKPQLFDGRCVILAGGFCNRETLFLAAMLGADAVQMGTVYLGTEEIVRTGALSALYQKLILESGPGDTVTTGESIGLRVRSLRTEMTENVFSLERHFAAGGSDEATFRQKIKAGAAGSLQIAARAVDGRTARPLDEATCRRQGEFMSGSCAGLIDRVKTLRELHRELAESPLPDGLPILNPFGSTHSSVPQQKDGIFVQPQRSRPMSTPVRHMHHAERIAVTGRAVFNSLGNSPQKVWGKSKALASGVVEVPASRWDHSLYYDPRPRAPEKTYCRVAAFQHLVISRKELSIPPQDFRTMTDATKATLWLARQAVEDSGILDADIPRERIGVFVSQNSGEAAKTLADVLIRSRINEIVAPISALIPFTPELRVDIERAIKSNYMAVDDTTLLGRLTCTAAGFICNTYGFMGPSFAVSAACASSLAALYSAYQMIQNDVLDAAIVGGAEEPLTAAHFLEFSALGALSGLSGNSHVPHQASRPFDAGRDGMVLGEGGGMLVIERASVARRRAARVHGYVTSMGAGNSHLGMVESSRETQEMTMKASFRDAGYGPKDVDLVECHATATIQGDIEEFHAVRRLFDPAHPTVLAAFKSQIGHTLGASGLNGLIRALTAAGEGVFPPSLNFETPDPQLGYEGSGLIIHREPAEWRVSDRRPRRFQVNAFGFGGSNYVVQLEQATEDRDTVMVSSTGGREKLDSEPSILPEGLFLCRVRIDGKPHRLALVAEGEGEIEEMLGNFDPERYRPPLSPGHRKALARKGIFLAPEDLTVPPTAFVFPGQGAHYAGMGRELYETFPVIRDWLDRMAALAEFDLLHLLFEQQEEELIKTRWQQPALFALEFAMARYMLSLGVSPVALAGHSLGELTALCLAGVYSWEDGFRIVDKRAQCMQHACDTYPDPGIMVATDAPLDLLRDNLRGDNRLHVTNINSPRQVVFGGAGEACTSLMGELEHEGYRSRQLPVSMTFHSPIMACIRDEMQAFVAAIDFHPPQLPVVSNTTGRPFPDNPDEIRRILMAHLESPVHWMQNVHTLHDDFGIRLFVEVGPRDILSTLIADTLGDARCVTTCLPTAEASVMKTALARLFADGLLSGIRPPKWVSLSERPLLPETQNQHVDPSPRTDQGPRGNPHEIDDIIQREISAFVFESFGSMLRPRILETLRHRLDPHFSEERLGEALRILFARTDGGEPAGLRSEPESADRPIGEIDAGAPAGSPQKNGEVTADITETVIRIIMNATGYGRDEIEPDMDLREDLAIRSSRLPVILDAMEQRFGRPVDFQTFMGVRTVRDLADRLSLILEEKEDSHIVSSDQGDARRALPIPRTAAFPSPNTRPVKRFVFRESPLEPCEYRPIGLIPADGAAVISPTGNMPMGSEAGSILRRDYGIRPGQMTFLAEEKNSGKDAFDLRSPTGALAMSERLRQVDSLAGLVLVMDENIGRLLHDVSETTAVTKGLFGVMKTFCDSPPKKFIVVIHKASGAYGLDHVLLEGLHGMLLSLAHEFPELLFRTVRIDDSTPLKTALREALNRNQKVMETIYRNHEAFTRVGGAASLEFESLPGMTLNKGDVVVLSGGGYGITSYLARPLIPYGCRIVFLGRAVPDSGQSVRPPDQGLGCLSRADDVARTLEAFHAMGAEASYFSCDVTDRDKTAEVLSQISEKYGRIDAMIHGAGIIQDRPFREMSADDFARVFDVKFQGAWNLYKGAENAGLRCFICLSSAAAILGNPGQVNYSAANRAMSALVTYIHEIDPSLYCKALMLPPIEGAGMAGDPVTKAVLERLNVGYFSTGELAGLFAREIRFGGTEDPWVMFMRSLPPVDGVRISEAEMEAKGDEISAATINFKRDGFPMIDRVRRIDLGSGELLAERCFSHAKDLWLADHKPLKSLRHPVVSAIMVIETFIEATRMLYPALEVKEVRDVEFLELLECPPDLPRSSRILCRTLQPFGAEIICELTLTAPPLSPAGREGKTDLVHYRAQVSMGAGREGDPGLASFVSIGAQELDTPALRREHILRQYEALTDLRGRYRLMEEVEGAGDGVIRARFVYPEHDDFSGSAGAAYQYSPYLLEALMQAAVFYLHKGDREGRRAAIPRRIGRLTFSRLCRGGERITVEARVASRNETAISWSARAIDEDKRTIMSVRDLELIWFQG